MAEMRYLPREDAPIGDRVWSMIEEAVIGPAKMQLAGRRLLDIHGPFGLGTRTLDHKEREIGHEATFGDARARMTAPDTTPIPLIYSRFELAIREVAAAEEKGSLLDLDAPARAAIACARLEDDVIFNGSPDLRIDGLLTAPKASRVQLGDWWQLGQPVEDLIKASNALDAAGFPGPYTAALAPSLYNVLFRRYQETSLTQLEHARLVIAGGIVKAPTLASGGVVLASLRHFASLVIGQDMTPAFVGPAPTGYEFVIMESIAPRITVPEAICVLQAK
jgi:uncharacterized linocin/CFP29 family protein